MAEINNDFYLQTGLATESRRRKSTLSRVRTSWHLKTRSKAPEDSCRRSCA